MRTRRSGVAERLGMTTDEQVRQEVAKLLSCDANDVGVARLDTQATYPNSFRVLYKEYAVVADSVDFGLDIDDFRPRFIEPMAYAIRKSIGSV